jgi:hypothetical protein
MAQMVESVAVVKVSKLVRDGEVTTEMLDDDVMTQLEAVLGELVGDSSALVEVIKADE